MSFEKKDLISKLKTGNLTDVSKALKDMASSSKNQNLKKINVLVISSFIIEPQLHFLELGMLLAGLDTKFQFKYTRNINEHINSDNDEATDFYIILWRFEDLFPKLGFISCYNNDEKNYIIANNYIKNLLENLQSKSCKPIFISNFFKSYSFKLCGNNSSNTIDLLNNTINKFSLETSNLYLLDFANWVFKVGVDSAFNLKMDYYARLPLSHKHIGNFSLFLAKSINLYYKTTYKVIVTDLDNTLWGGVIDEGSFDHLQIGNDFPGNIFRDIQLFLKRLKQKGFLLVLCSKNDKGIVSKAFKHLNDQMPLRLEDFDAVEINWKNKYENIIKVSKELDLSLDSFVFIDDQHFEREQIGYFLPEVKVINSSGDPLAILTDLLEFDGFETNTTDEDKNRSKFYSTQPQREKLRENSKNFNKFLEDLKLEISIHKINESYYNRVSQIFERTNQFNLTGTKFDVSELKKICQDDLSICLVLKAKDRFSDLGAVASVIATNSNENSENPILEIINFALSCRAFDRNFETLLFVALHNTAITRGFKEIRACYRPSPKNKLCKSFFKTQGMNVSSENKFKTNFRVLLKNKINYKMKYKIHFDYE